MTSTFSFTKSSLLPRLQAIEPAWRFALGAFVIARLWFLVWPLIVSSIIPVALQNLNLFGTPIVAIFDLSSSERYVYSRQIDGAVLSFRPSAQGYISDGETGSTWSLKDGQAQSGQYEGRSLQTASYSVEDVYPYHNVAPDPNPVLGLWQRFDANWLLAIAEHGYSASDGSSVYFPLYPFLIRIAGALLFGKHVLGAIVISNLALVGALYLLYKQSAGLVGEGGARRTLAYLLVFPTSFFLLAPYTESLFLFLSLAAIYAAGRKKWVPAGVLGALAALTRLQGLVLIVPLAYLAWEQKKSGGWQANHAREVLQRTKSIITSFSAAIFLIPLATGVFLAATNLSLLRSYEGQLHARFVWPWDNILSSVSLMARGDGGVADAANLASTLIFAAMCAVVWSRLPLQYVLYSLGMLLAPMFRMTSLQPLVSMTRYMLVLFPVMIVWATWGSNQWFNRLILYLSVALNLYFSAQFFMWGWVA